MSKVSKISSAPLPPAELYERDYYTWTQEQARALRERRLEEVDWTNVAEEIEDLGKREKRALRSQLVRLLGHLIKFAYAREVMWTNNSRGWELSIRGARREALMYLDENPGLRPHTPQIFGSAYGSARLEVMKALRFPDSAIPEAPPWTLDEIIDDAFLPPRNR
jgi:Domain of unknown function DUF29